MGSSVHEHKEMFITPLIIVLTTSKDAKSFHFNVQVVSPLAPERRLVVMPHAGDPFIMGTGNSFRTSGSFPV